MTTDRRAVKYRKPTDADLLFGIRVRQERERLALSPLELARRADVHVQCLTRLESGRTRLHFATAAKLADALGVGLDALRVAR